MKILLFLFALDESTSSGAFYFPIKNPEQVGMFDRVLKSIEIRQGLLSLVLFFSPDFRPGLFCFIFLFLYFAESIY